MNHKEMPITELVTTNVQLTNSILSGNNHITKYYQRKIDEHYKEIQKQQDVKDLQKILGS